jgi:hypothetical protein
MHRRAALAFLRRACALWSSICFTVLDGAAWWPGGLLPTGLVEEADRRNDPGGGEAPRARRPGAGVGGRTGAGSQGLEEMNCSLASLRLRRLL